MPLDLRVAKALVLEREASEIRLLQHLVLLLGLLSCKSSLQEP